MPESESNKKDDVEWGNSNKKDGGQIDDSKEKMLPKEPEKDGNVPAVEKLLVVEPPEKEGEEKLPEVAKLLIVEVPEKGVENSSELRRDRKVSLLSTGNKELAGFRRYLGLIYTLLSTNSFALSSTVLKLYTHIHPFNLFTWAFPLAAILSLPFLIYRVAIQKKNVISTFWPIRKHKRVVFFIWFRAVLSSLISYVIAITFKYISVGDTRTIMAASVITVYFFGWLCLGESCGIVPIVVAVMALLGIGVMTRPPALTGAAEFSNETLIGVSLAVVCLILATGIILTIRYLQNVHHGVLNCFLYTWCFAQSFVLALIFGKFELPATGMDAFAMLSVGTLMALGNMFLVLALQAEEAGVVALIRTSEVIFTFFWQFIVIGIKPDYISILGAALVLTGVIVVTIRKWIGSLPPGNATRKKLAFLLK